MKGDQWYSLGYSTILHILNDMIWFHFSKLPYAINNIYFWYSLLYLIGRSICMFLSAAAIHDASRKPLEIIRNTPTTSWCNEVFSVKLFSYRWLRIFYKFIIDWKIRIPYIISWGNRIVWQEIFSFNEKIIVWGRLSYFDAKISYTLIINHIFSLIFQMAGTIVTYELVLLQFDSESKKNVSPTKHMQCEIAQLP